MEILLKIHLIYLINKPSFQIIFLFIYKHLMEVAKTYHSLLHNSLEQQRLFHQTVERLQNIDKHIC